MGPQVMGASPRWLHPRLPGLARAFQLSKGTYLCPRASSDPHVLLSCHLPMYLSLQQTHPYTCCPGRVCSANAHLFSPPHLPGSP